MKFNHWTVIDNNLDEKNRFLCRCICGSEKWINYYNLLHGKSKSCCKYKEPKPVVGKDHPLMKISIKLLEEL